MTQEQHSKLFIDGQAIPFEEGQTIMDAALAADIYIPHLCHRPGLKPHGSCRLCTVNVNNRPCCACTTKAEANQQVENNTNALNKARKLIVQMLFTEANHLCPSCEKSGDCSLQAVAYSLGMLDGHFPPFFPRREVDASHVEFMLDRDRCILCELCVRASRDIDGKNVFALTGRGKDRHLIVNSGSGKLKDSQLTASDLAANICPVGAILKKHHGYDVPIGERTFDRHKIADVNDHISLIRREKNDK